MAGTSNFPLDANQYLYASIANVSNSVVSVKLSDKHNYPLWKAQMVCLMGSHNMCGIVDDTVGGPKFKSKTIEKQYECLLKSWIFGSVSKDVLPKVFDLTSAKDVWEKLSSTYDPTFVPQHGSGSTEIEKEDEPGVGLGLIIVCENEEAPTENKGTGDVTIETQGGRTPALSEDEVRRLTRKIILFGSKGTTMTHDFQIQATHFLKKPRYLDDDDEGTFLHHYTEQGSNVYLKRLLTITHDEEFLKQKNKKGDTALHLAATIGNTEAVNVMVKANKSLLLVPNAKGEGPLDIAYQNMHFDIIEHLLTVSTDDYEYGNIPIVSFTSDERGDKLRNDILISLINAKKHTLAWRLIEQHTYSDMTRDDVLMALATAYPSALTDWEIFSNLSSTKIEKEDEPGVGLILNEAPTENKGTGDVTIETQGGITPALSKDELRELIHDIINGSKGTTNSVMTRDFQIQATNFMKEKLSLDPETKLHEFSKIGDNERLKRLLTITSHDEDYLKRKDEKGDTALHLVATLGNTEAVDILAKANKSLLLVPNAKGEGPLDIMHQNMDIDIIKPLFTVSKHDYEKVKKKPIVSFKDDERGHKLRIDILSSLITAKKYILALRLLQQHGDWEMTSDDVLMALATTYPTELTYWESFFYPSPEIDTRVGYVLKLALHEQIGSYRSNNENLRLSTILQVPVRVFYFARYSILFLKSMAGILSGVAYLYSWNIAAKLVTPVKNIKKKRRELIEARDVLRVVIRCMSRGHNYAQSLFEAERQDAYEVVSRILRTFDGINQYKDGNGHDAIQRALLHRSENVYNLIHGALSDKKITYRTKVDSSGNNMLHLAGRLAPSHRLRNITGAALQLQRELQWQEEVKKLVFPTLVTKENYDGETPDMVFTEQHKSLVKDGENWMKGTAESCSITAALITTIVFAAAITVPGGSSQDTGIPVFTKSPAFFIFAIADAISLFTSTTSLLVFLSILTARFSQQDFLVKLPRRLIIGLSTLLISTIAMIIAFGATLFLVFCHQKPWMLAPICLLALLPIWFFVTLQFPLIVDLILSTHVSIFGRKRDVIGLFAGDDYESENES